MSCGNDYECPKCGEWLWINENTPADQFECSWCHAKLELDADAEFVNGSWRDLSKLVEVKPSNWDLTGIQEAPF